MLTYIIIGILYWFIVALVSSWAGMRLVGVKTTARTTVKLAVYITGLVVLTGTVMGIMSAYVADAAVLGVTSLVLTIVLIVGSYYLWQRVLRRVYQLPTGRTVGSFLLAAILSMLLLLLTTFVLGNYVRTFQMIGPVMEPTIEEGERFIGYLQAQPESDDVIVYETVSDITAVGRVRGTPGQTVENEQGFLRISDGSKIDGPSYELAEGEYYVRGDNTENSVPRIITDNDIIAVAGPQL